MFGKARKIRKLLARTKVPAKRALLIGDEIRDCEAAHTAGVAFGAVSWGYNSLEALRAHEPTEFFATMSDIQRLFEAADLRFNLVFRQLAPHDDVPGAVQDNNFPPANAG